MRIEFKTCAGYEVSYREWGAVGAPVVLCLHGLGGHGQNFTQIGESLQSDFRVIAPDLIGRGYSAWATSPESEYCFEVYDKIIESLVAQLEIETLSWLGVSMGGALGIRLASGGFRERVNALIVNDIGLELLPDVAAAIYNAVRMPTRFGSFAELVRYYEQMFGAFGMKASAERSWAQMALTGARRLEDGAWTLQFDPHVAIQLANSLADYQQDGALARINAPMLLFRGAQSDVLRGEHASGMAAQKSDLELVEIEGVGHAPLLDRPQDLEKIRQFLSVHGGEGAA